MAALPDEENLRQVIEIQMLYHCWATREMWRGIACLQESELNAPKGTSFGTLLATLSHMYAADRVWLNRLSGSGAPQIVDICIPTASLLEQVWEDTLNEFCRWTGGLTDDGLSRRLYYSNSKGQQFETPVWQILLHVVNHGTGHRGQVNGIMRQAGAAPMTTDLIQFYKNRAVK